MAHSTTRIMIVEDDPLLALMMEGMVEDLGYWVVGPLSRLDDGLKHARLDDLDFALLDFDLGAGTDATPIARELISRGIPYAFTTGTDPSVIKRLFKETTIISKPVVEAELLEVLP